MRRLIDVMTVFLTVLSSSAFSVQSNPDNGEMTAKLNAVNIPFVMNNGQAPESVISYAQTFAGRVSVMLDGSWTYSLPHYAGQAETEHSMPPPMLNSSTADEMKIPQINGWVVLNERLCGAKGITPQPAGEVTAQVSFFHGSDPSQWKHGLSTWKQIDMGEVYDGITLALIASTYIGGSMDEYGYSVIEAANGDIIIAGNCRGASEYQCRGK